MYATILLCGEEGRARKSRQTLYAMILLGGGKCRARKSRQILYAMILLLWSASGSACGSRITGGKSSHSGFSHRSDTPEVRATFVCEVQEPRQPTRLRQQATPLARDWFHRPAQVPLQGDLEELENLEVLAAPEGRKTCRRQGLVPCTSNAEGPGRLTSTRARPQQRRQSSG